MFTIEPQTGFVLYLLLALGGLCVAVVYEVYRTEIRRWTLSKHRLRRCTDCNFTFVVARAETVARCPRCRKVSTMRGR
ncbi:MAG: hypothetical protein A3K19_10045 [Lentisphaerae bacterium RIFOXYB12_FULL_65_16]|nr:MAG: hypothetical protein A3K18_27795 [Lentisphaerae bacterium RIFOXYA12_64_32]OGV91290.1 MAG: hypothetical protein A3K19_10045 [Lentisphaerae bacterium RIFOXYB12_FULL_65_16]